ncbi:hypothetical protein [Nocardia asiatica]|uniref:hypothetical protein n=1 Tax=Nocardia asiatica TaxID=209252 RepID=UPI002454DEC9|nr:hypothetical protein [Nocardia asiatica]
MTQVRISITSEVGDVDVTEEERFVRYGDREEERIGALLSRALDKVDRAYGLSQKRATEAPNPTGGEAL